MVTHSHACADCAVNTWPWESFMVNSSVWAEAGAGSGFLCVACLEERLERVLTPEDFPPLPLNDDEACDSVRLRTRKGSGRAVEGLYRIATAAVLDLGVDAPVVAEILGIGEGLLEIRVDGARFNRAALAEIEADEMPTPARRLAVGMANTLMRGDHEH